MIQSQEKHKIGLVGAVLRGIPPKNCSMGCHEFLSEDICGTCYRRPIKSIEVQFGNEPTLSGAVAKGLVTPTQIHEFVKQISGG